MEDKKVNALDNFLPEDEESQEKKKVVLKEREGLVERVDKIYVTNDGRQLLREQY